MATTTATIWLVFLCVLVCQQAKVAASGYFVCNSTGQPIPTTYRCDDTMDCTDGSDEDDCSSTGCSIQAEFTCNNGHCIAIALRCDGTNHCLDGSDEDNCPQRDCHSSEFRCNNGKCIRRLFLCDGQNHCGDNSDEEGNCTTSVTPTAANGCPANMPERCMDLSMCISSLWRCDGFDDCGDMSDENNCSAGVSCGVGRFKCLVVKKGDNIKCIVSEKVCDGHYDCTDHSDEDEDRCFHLNCNSDRFSCPDRCINIHKKCNGQYDCVDNSDEFNCSAANCQPHQYSCISHQQCIPAGLRCNGNEDCVDGSDEFLCPVMHKVECEETEFSCLDQLGCLNKESYCDGTPQCGDGSDEEDCTGAIATSDECADHNGGCKKICVDTTHGHFCSCPRGYHIAGRNRTHCIDTDECETPGICSQYCNNNNGSYSCSCALGYYPEAGGRCQATGPEPFLLVANYLDILRISTNGTSVQTVVDELSTIAIDFHFTRGLMFWIDIKKYAIMKANFDGSGVSELIDYGLRRPDGLAVDWVNDKLYWTDTDLDTIEVAGITGNPRTVLITRSLGDDPTDIVVDPSSRTLFWIEQSRIMRASMDGKNVEVLHNENVYGPTGLTLHHPTSTLYWIDLRAQGIDSCHVNGTERRQIRAKNVVHPIALTVFEDNLYWLEGGDPSIMTANRRNGSQGSRVTAAIFKPMDLVIVHPLRQPIIPQFTNPCSDNNGGCSYLCLLSNSTSAGYSCLCPFGTKHINESHCTQANKFLLFSRTEDLHTIPLPDRPPTDLTDIVLPISGLSSVSAVAWDSDIDTIFWADSIRGTISSSHITGNRQKELISGDVDNPSGLAVDWVTRKLYWTDKALSRISVSNLDGSSATILLFEGFKDLNDIVVHPLLGQMYWVDNGNNNNLPKIEKANLDGTERSTLYTVQRMPDSPTSIISALSIDYTTNRLYWVDRGYLELNSIKLDGSDKMTILSGGSDFVSPMGVTALDNIVFWTEMGDKDLRWFNVSNSSQEVGVVIGGRKNLQRITLFHRELAKPVSHPCWVNNGNCSQLCLSRPVAGNENMLEASCVCRIGYRLQDKHTCISTVNDWFAFATRSGLQWFSEDITTRKVVIEPPILPFSSSITSLDVDRENDTIYWIDSSLKGIYRGLRKGGQREVVVTRGLKNPVALAVDWMGKNLYWADSGTRRIEVSRLNGAYRRVLVEGSMVGDVTALIVDLKSHYMFWATSTPPRVYRAVMDGSRAKPIVTQGLVNPVSLVVHNPGFNGIIYILDTSPQSIYSYSLDGRQTGVAAANIPSAVGVAYDSMYLYFVRRTANDNILYRVRRSDGLYQFQVTSGLGVVRDMKYIKMREWMNRGSLHYPCLGNVPCSGLCLPNLDTASEQYTCACSTGVLPKSGACTKYPSLYILFSTRTTIQRLSLDVEAPTTLTVTNQPSIDLVDYHLGSKSIVWTDNSSNSIMMASLDGDNVRSIKSGIRSIGGIAVDWITGNVYYTDTDTRLILVLHRDGYYLQLSFSTMLNNPTSIAVDPRNGWIFWINGQQLARAKMDGSSSSILRYVGSVKHLTMDIEQKRLYWVNTQNGRVESVDYNNQNHRYITTSMESPASLAFHDNFVFWVNSARRSITRARKSDGHNIFTMYNDQRDGGPRRIAVVGTTGRPGEADGDNHAGPCSYFNGGCSHFCLALSSSERFCACPTSRINGVCTESRGIPPPVPNIINPFKPTQKSSPSLESSQPLLLPTSSHVAVDVMLPFVTPTSTPFNDTTLLSSAALSEGEVGMLIVILLLFFIVTAIAVVLITLFIKRKSLTRYKVDVNPTVSAWNPSYRSRDSVSPIFRTLPRKSNKPSPPVSPKPKSHIHRRHESAKSISPLEEVETDCSVFEGPQMYQMTPQQCRKSSGTPPASPLPVTTTVQAIVNPVVTRPPPPPLPPKPNYSIPKPNYSVPKPPQPPAQTERTPVQKTREPRQRGVMFDLDPSTEPPPIPPRSLPTLSN